MSVQQGQSHQVTLPSVIPRLFSLLDVYLNALALPVLIQFCCSVAVSTGSCTPCELELVQVSAYGRQIFPVGVVQYTPTTLNWPLCPCKMHCDTPGCACLSSPYILDVENRTNFILNKSHLRCFSLLLYRTSFSLNFFSRYF